MRRLGGWLSGVAAIFSMGIQAQSEPLNLHFMEIGDIREPENVLFTAHPFTLENSRILLESSDDRPSLWQMPTDAIQLDDKIAIYYQRVEKEHENYVDQRTWCLGYLKPDGSFERPDLNLFDQSWPGPHNVVLQRSPHTPTWGGFNVFQVVPDPDGGWISLYWDQPAEGQAGAMIASSTDGIHWTKKTEDKAVFTEHNDAYSLIQSGDEYLLYQTRLLEWPEKPFEDNLPGKRRSLSIRRSSDLHEWTPQEDILEPDASDAPTTEFYLINVFRYADRYAGIVMKYYADPTQPKKHSGILKYELVTSPDGIEWRRPYRETDMAAWSYAAPFEMDNRLCLAAHNERDIRLYWLRKDGLVSCGTEGEGSFWTQPIEFPKGPLTLNADCSEGSIQVEVLDQKGVSFEGLENPILTLEGQDSVDLALEWSGSDRTKLEGEAVHLKFTLSNAQVYSLYEATE
ncbi:MAG: hypothetical protein KC994_09500 [Candidatus Omnitrophica bacterium]|nr:hypothetical protein [Candidatus Omnitrophota bacterium]